MIGNFKVCQLLLKHGASVDALDEDQETPLHWAVISGNDKVFQVLLHYGASKYLKTRMAKLRWK